MSNLFLSLSYLLRGDSKGDGSQVHLVVSEEQRWSQLGVWELAWQPGHENKCVVRFTFAVCNSCFFLNESLLGNQVMKINVLAPLAFPLTSFSKPIAKFFIHIWRIWEKMHLKKDTFLFTFAWNFIWNAYLHFCQERSKFHPIFIWRTNWVVC